MRRFAFFFLIIAAIAVMTSCASVKGVGRGYSDSKQIAVEKADMNAFFDISRQNKVSVSESSKIETTDVDGKASSKYSSKKEMATATTLTDVKLKRNITRRGSKYDVVSKANATIVEE